MLETVEAAGVFGGYLEDLCYTPKTLKAIASVRAGAIGDVTWVRSRETHPGPHSAWFWDGRLTGGGAIIDLGCHCIEIIRNFVGKGNRPVEVLCHTDTLVHPIADEDNAVALIRFESGAIGQFEVSWTFRGGMDLRDEVAGTHGTIWMNHFLRTGFEMFTRRRRRGYVAEKAETLAGLAVPGRRRGVRARLRRHVQRHVPRDRRGPRAAGDALRRLRRERDHGRGLPVGEGPRLGAGRAATGAAARRRGSRRRPETVRGPGRDQARDPARTAATSSSSRTRPRATSATGSWRAAEGEEESRWRHRRTSRSTWPRCPRTGVRPSRRCAGRSTPAAPEATETIAYSMPALRSHGGQFLGVVRGLQEALQPVPGERRGGRGAGRRARAVPGRARDDPVPGRLPIPLDLVRRIVEIRVGENAERASGSRTNPSGRGTTSGAPDGSPASIQRAIDSREKSWSTTIAEAPMTPASAAERRPLDEQVARGQRQRAAVDRLADGGQQLVAALGHAAADDDQRRVEEVHDARQHRARPAGRPPGAAPPRPGRRTTPPARRPPRSRSPRWSSAVRSRALRPSRAAASPARPSAAPPASASRQPMLPQRQTTDASSTTWMWPTSPALPWAPRWSRPSEMIPAPMPGPDLDDDDVVVADRDAGSPLAEGEDVDVVVDPDRRAIARREPLPDRIAVPAGHDRRRDRPPAAELDRPGHADADAPQTARQVRVVAQQLSNSSSTRSRQASGPGRDLGPARRDGRGSGRRGS